MEAYLGRTKRQIYKMGIKNYIIKKLWKKKLRYQL